MANAEAGAYDSRNRIELAVLGVVHDDSRIFLFHEYKERIWDNEGASL